MIAYFNIHINCVFIFFFGSAKDESFGWKIFIRPTLKILGL